MKMLSVLVPCYFCFTRKLKKVVVYFLCISCLGLEYLELSWCVFFNKSFRVLHSVWVKFNFSYVPPSLPILNTVLHNQGSCNSLKKTLVIWS